MKKTKKTATVLVIPGGKQKGKALRTARRRVYYAAQFARTDKNRKRRMMRHIRSHPNDKRAAHTYEFEKHFGPPESLGLSSKGRKRQARHAAAVA